MPYYEMDLELYLSQLEGVDKLIKILDIAFKLVIIYQHVHCAKRTYNDLKAKNIMVKTQEGLDADPEVYLIDYGLSFKYIQKDNLKQHIEDTEQVKNFRGNMAFASVRQMDFLKTSRKDDLISLFYFLIYLLNNKNLWVGAKDHNPCQNKDKITENFHPIKNWKKQHTLSTIADLFCLKFVFPGNLKCGSGHCADQDRQIKLFQLNIGLIADEIQNIGFAEKPPYDKIKNYLAECKLACQKINKK